MCIVEPATSGGGYRPRSRDQGPPVGVQSLQQHFSASNKRQETSNLRARAVCHIPLPVQDPLLAYSVALLCNLCYDHVGECSHDRGGYLDKALQHPSC
jgi:hypothetical protein